MTTTILILAELLILFFLSKHILTVMYTLLYLLTRSKTASIGLVTFIHLPGTVVHEFAHLIVAEILRVRTYGISFTPEIKHTENGVTDVTAGHVKLAQSDPIRRYIIGFAPLFFGLFFLVLLIWLFNYFWPQLPDSLIIKTAFVVLIGYFLFAVSNNMFSSKKDLEGFIFFVPIFIIVGASAYIAGFRLTLTGKVLEAAVSAGNGLQMALAIVIGVNIVILILNGLLLRGILKISRRKLL